MENKTQMVTSKQLKSNSDRFYLLWHKKLLESVKIVNPRIHRILTGKHDLKKYSKPFGSSYIYGIVGAGKSVRAMWMMMECFRLKYIYSQCPKTYEFITCDELLMEIKKTFNSSKVSEFDIIEHYQNIDVLVIDDIGVMSTTDWSYKTLYVIINHRYSHYKTTIYTSNKSLDELSDLLQDDRITDRIQHDCEDRIYQFKNKSRRK